MFYTLMKLVALIVLIVVGYTLFIEQAPATVGWLAAALISILALLFPARD